MTYHHTIFLHVLFNQSIMHTRDRLVCAGSCHSLSSSYRSVNCIGS